MKNNKWHLGTNFSPSLFRDLWSQDSHGYLLNLFGCLEESEHPIMSMLPPGVTPAGAAAAAALYFLPNLKRPPAPHCRIALFPGLHFVRQLKDLTFGLEETWRAIQKARVSGGFAASEGPFDLVRKKMQGDVEGQQVNFHWVFRCQRMWTRHWQQESVDLEPRGYFGRGDPYSPTVSLIESQHLDLFSTPDQPYDLLIYCPYFHSRTTEQTESDLEQLLRKIDSFSADRKLIVARSPYDYWSRRIENKLKIVGLAFVVGNPKTETPGSGIEFQIVDQIINTSEAFTLNRELTRIWRTLPPNGSVLNELKFILSRLLVGLNPVPKEEDGSFDQEIEEMLGLARGLGILETSQAWGILLEIGKRLRDGNFNTKAKRLEELGKAGNIEIWVTKDDDKNLLNDAKQRHGLDIEIRMANRWMAPGVRSFDRKVVLSRIDRLVDLNLVPYLQFGDTIMMSAWETIIRGRTTMHAWECSERWREKSRSKGIVSSNLTSTDSVLELASYVDSIISNHVAAVQQPASSELDETGETSWWDSNDIGSLLATDLNRGQLLANTGATKHPCREIAFEGGLGMFLREHSEVQVISDSNGEGDIISVSCSDMQVGTTIVLFKDSERNSMFDILIDQLERSEEYGDDAKLVRKWKERLRAHAVSKDVNILDLSAQLKRAGGSFEPLTVKSWVFGSTMAPMAIENLRLLVDVLQFKDVNVPMLFTSVQRLRGVARVLGKALNSLIVHKSLENVPVSVRNTINQAGVDVDELSAAVETRLVVGISETFSHIETAHIGKLFKLT